MVFLPNTKNSVGGEKKKRMFNPKESFQRNGKEGQMAKSSTQNHGYARPALHPRLRAWFTQTAGIAPRTCMI